MISHPLRQRAQCVARQSVSVHAPRARSIKTVSRTLKNSPEHFQLTESESEAFHVAGSDSEAFPDASARTIQHVVVPRALIPRSPAGRMEGCSAHKLISEIKTLSAAFIPHRSEGNFLELSSHSLSSEGTSTHSEGIGHREDMVLIERTNEE